MALLIALAVGGRCLKTHHLLFVPSVTGIGNASGLMTHTATMTTPWINDMNITSNWYGDVRLRLLGLVFTLSSAFTCAWRDLTIHAGDFCLLWIQFSFWNHRSDSLKQKAAGIRLRVEVGKHELFHHTILPMTNWHWHYKHPWRRKALGWLLDRWTVLVWKIAKRFVDRRYSPASKLWDAQCAEHYRLKTGKFVGARGNELLEYR